MVLEEYGYKIEIRKGVLHGNADGMSRECHGTECICDELLAYERKYKVKKGQILEGKQQEVAAFYCNTYVTKSIDVECERVRSYSVQVKSELRSRRVKRDAAKRC